MQGIFLILVMCVIAITTFWIGTTSANMTELMGRAILWGLVIGSVTAIGWTKL